MKKRIILTICLALGLILINSSSSFARSDENKPNNNFQYTCFVQKSLTKEATQLNRFLAEYFNAFEKHNVKKLSKLYAAKFISGDGLNKQKLMKMIGESWTLSPDLKYSKEIQDVKFDKFFASVEINENLFGATKQKSNITGDKGLIESVSKTVLYLQKFGQGWKIVSDRTLYEETSIKYGDAKDIESAIIAPDQVFNGKKYTISLKTDIPDNVFAIGSLVTEPLGHHKNKTKEIFRHVPADIKLIERLVQANNKNFNELAVGFVSYCKIDKNSSKKPEIKISGTATLLKRVNVINKVVTEK